jgi:hypothetical protein
LLLRTGGKELSHKKINKIKKKAAKKNASFATLLFIK